MIEKTSGDERTTDDSSQAHRPPSGSGDKRPVASPRSLPPGEAKGRQLPPREPFLLFEPQGRKERNGAQNYEPQHALRPPRTWSLLGFTLQASRSTFSSLLGRILLAISVAICLAFLVLPLLALLMRVPFGTLLAYLGEPVVQDALRISLISSLTSLALIVLFGTPTAYLLARYNFRGKSVVETLIELPLVLPPAVAGVALLFAFGRRTPFGDFLRGFNLEIAFTIFAVVLAQVFVAAPFYIRSARAGFQGVPSDLMDVARTQGAGGWQVFRHVVMPLAMPGVAGGMILAWARAIGEFGATILFAGNFQGVTQTMPLAIYTALESDINGAIVLSSILVVASFGLLITFKLLTNKQVDVIGLGE